MTNNEMPIEQPNSTPNSPRPEVTAPEYYTQTRLRLNHPGALLLEQLLLAEEQRLLVARSQTTDRTQLNRNLYTVRRVKAELRRAMDDKQW